MSDLTHHRTGAGPGPHTGAALPGPVDGQPRGEPASGGRAERAHPDRRPADADLDRRGARTRRRTLAVLGLSFAAYLALSVVLWWGAWSTHPTSVTTCGCNDPALFLWFLEWPAYALAHGHDLFYSTALFHPTGIDLLANTSVLAIGVPLAPVTWIWGPVATLNVASTLAPALSALSMCWLLLRWVRWAPAAFVGGLLFGFSPFVVTSLASAHLMTATLVVLPLMVACLDELLVRQRHGPVAVGVALGLLVVVQFFVGTEVLVVAVVLGVVGVAMVTGYAAVAHREILLAHLGPAARGLAVAGVVAAVLLAYPLWVALAGPAHLSGLVWPTIEPGSGGMTLHALAVASHGNPSLSRLLSGYQGPGLVTGAYVGVGALVVALGGVLAYRHDRRLWCFGAVGLVAVALALGSQSYWTPWRVLEHLPILENVLPARIMAVVTLCLAVVVAIVVDRVRDTVQRAIARWSPSPARSPGRLARWTAALSALAVGAVVLAPMAAALAGDVPLTTVAVTEPRWFHDAAHLPPGRVVLTFPPPSTGGAALAWQAQDGMHYALATGAGPGSVLSRAGPERAGQAVLDRGSAVFAAPPPVTPHDVRAVRHALDGWGVTEVAVPSTAAFLPPFRRPQERAWAEALFTLAIGRAPTYTGATWVWTGVRSPGTGRTMSTSDFTACTTPAMAARPSPSAVPDCVLHHSVPAT